MAHEEERHNTIPGICGRSTPWDGLREQQQSSSSSSSTCSSTSRTPEAALGTAVEADTYGGARRVMLKRRPRWTYFGVGEYRPYKRQSGGSNLPEYVLVLVATFSSVNSSLVGPILRIIDQRWDG